MTSIQNAYQLEEIANRQSLTERGQKVFLTYEKEMFDKASFEWFDDLNSLRVQLAQMTGSDESCQKAYLDFLYECLVDNAINYKKYQVNETRKLLFFMRYCLLNLVFCSKDWTSVR